MHIQVLGFDDAPTRQTCRHVAEALARLGQAATVEHVSDMDQITTFGVMATPAVVADGEVLVVGRVPTVEELAGWLGNKVRSKNDE